MNSMFVRVPIRHGSSIGVPNKVEKNTKKSLFSKACTGTSGQRRGGRVVEGAPLLRALQRLRRPPKI